MPAPGFTLPRFASPRPTEERRILLLFCLVIAPPLLLLSKGQSTSQQLRQLLLLQVVRVDATLLPDVVSEGGLRRQVELVLQASDLRLQVPVVAVRRHLLRVRGLLLARDLGHGRRRDHEDLAEFRFPPRAHRGRPTRRARARGIATASVLAGPGRGRGRGGGDPPPRQSAYRGRDGLLLPSSRRRRLGRHDGTHLVSGPGRRAERLQLQRAGSAGGLHGRPGGAGRGSAPAAATAAPEMKAPNLVRAGGHGRPAAAGAGQVFTHGLLCE
mmetsp:Transcript_43490/g.137523  ORF Transcript_43490/g.137523 Transcript_43490/m.137523 type:complete len:270 (-) Transcript_43490:1330-2139(-)